ncbi:MAG TPA: sulfite exporter TauE/SafE family protein [Panacibacter sp.]|nr:sulfite exporter TauE/SafE family protein [Panacibacter sp.]HNP44380.1 sulfite exporter TauE/SafE family protein [Panacibacter sp.]
MSAQTIMLLLVIGLLAGIISGLVGVGGGIIIVPALVLLLGFTQQQAQGTSLGLLLLPVGILAVWNYYQKGQVDIKIVLIMALAFTIGGWLGSKLALSISQADLKKVFAGVLIIVGIKMLFFDK